MSRWTSRDYDHLDPSELPPEGDEWLRDYYEDHYPQPHLAPEDMMTDEEVDDPYYSMDEIVEHCIKPTVADALAHVGKLLFWCLVFRMATQTGGCGMVNKGTNANVNQSLQKISSDSDNIYLYGICTTTTTLF